MTTVDPKTCQHESLYKYPDASYWICGDCGRAVTDTEAILMAISRLEHKISRLLPETPENPPDDKRATP